jgi:hypothetical protein
MKCFSKANRSTGAAGLECVRVSMHILSRSSLQPLAGLQNPIIGNPIKVQLKRLVLGLSGLQRHVIELHVQNHTQTSTFRLPGSELK